MAESILLCREGDEIHLVHVVPKLQMGACFGAPPVDFLPQQDPIAYDQLVKQAEAFIQMRFLPSLNSLRVHPIVHIVKVLTQSSSQDSYSLIHVPVITNHTYWETVRALPGATPSHQFAMR